MRLLLPARLRTRLPVVVVGLVTLGLVVAAVAFNLILGSVLSNDATDLARSRAAARTAALDVVNGRIVSEREAIGPGDPVWVFGPDGLVGPGVSTRLDQKAGAFVVGDRTSVDIEPEDLRLVKVPIAVGGRTVGTVVGSASLEAYERSRKIALIASLALVIVLAGVIAVAVRLIVVAALRPVARMTADAEDWSDHDLGRRFELGPPRDELTHLAATLDDLLARLAASLRREQRVTAELSHELRTPLAKVIAQGELALRRARKPSDYVARIGAMLASARQLARTMETLLAAARPETTGHEGLCDAAEAAATVIADCETLAAERHVTVTLAPPAGPAQIGLEASLVERILHPVIENACRYARSHVGVAIAARNGDVRVAVTDDGPGIDPDERDAVFEAGMRGRAGRASGGDGAGLGLALARRLARTAGGEVALDDRALGFEITLPAARTRGAGPQDPSRTDHQGRATPRP